MAKVSKDDAFSQLSKAEQGTVTAQATLEAKRYKHPERPVHLHKDVIDAILQQRKGELATEMLAHRLPARRGRD